MNARQSVRSLVEDLLESRQGAAGILQTREQSVSSAPAGNMFNKLKLIQKLQQQGVHPRDIHKLTGVHPSQQPPVASAATPPLGPKSAPVGLAPPVKPPTPIKPSPTPPIKSSPTSPSNPPLQSLQAKARHKGPHPSNKPSWKVKTAKYLGRKLASPHSILGVGAMAGADALVPGLGLVVRGLQQTFGK